MGDVHEVRIHGVNNTPPASMLGVAEDKVERVTGTDKEPTGFWHAPEDPPAAPIATREAYSWGGVNSAPTAKGKWAWAAVQRAAWLLLLPFALANVGYWTRAEVGADRDVVAGPGADAGTRRRANLGSFLFRFAALLLTALYVVTAVGIAVDQIAWQCFRNGTSQCGLSWLGFLEKGAWNEEARRLGVGAAGPVVVLVALGAVSRGTLQRYEKFPDDTPGRDGGHVLEMPDFWNGRERALRLQRLHLATGLFVVTLLTALPLRDDTKPAGVVLEYTLYAAVAGLVAVVAVTWLHRADGADYDGDAPWRHAPSVLIIFAIVTLALHLLVLLVWKHEVVDDGDLEGVGAAPLFVLLALCLTVLAVFLLRWHEAAAVVVPLLVAGAGVAAYDRYQDTPDGLRVGYAAAAGVLVVGGWWLHTASRESERVRWRAFGGTAPSVLLGAAVFVSVLFTTSATLLAGDRLNGGARVNALQTSYVADPVGPKPTCAADTWEEDRVQMTCTRNTGKTDNAHVVPVLHFWLALAVPATLVAWLLLAGMAMGLYWTSKRSRCGIPADVVKDYPNGDMVAKYQRAPVVAARRRAGFSRRAERVTGLLALPVTAAVLGAVAVAVAPVDANPFHEGSFLWYAVTAGLVVTVTAAGGLLALGLAAYRLAPLRRTLGVVWDLTSFWPRAVHPFAPPCYAERGVPELSMRTRWRLGTEKRVLFSAHSLGCLLAVASIFRFAPAERCRVLLLTYGCQLRVYFSRLFPAVLGPGVLGTAPESAPALARASAPDCGHVPGPSSLAADLGVGQSGGRWVNLYRESDPLGFRVYDDTSAVVDTKVLETAFPEGDPQPPPIATHSDYPRTTEYDEAVARLVNAPETRAGWGARVTALWRRIFR